MRALLTAALAATLCMGVQAQVPPSPQPGLPPPPTVPSKLPTTLTVPLTFTKLPTGVVPLHGRDPGASVQIAAAGGKEPLTLAFNADPAGYTSSFSLEQQLIGLLGDATLQPIGSSQPTVSAPTISRFLHFKGLPASQNLPSTPIHVFVRVTDGSGAVVEKTFDVRLTNASAMPVIDRATYAGRPGNLTPTPDPGNGPYTIFTIRHHGFLMSEQGSYFECKYPNGTRYRCWPWDNLSDATVTTLLVPDLNLGLSVSMRLVNDQGASAPVTLELKNSSLSVTETAHVYPNGPVGTAFAQLDKTSPQAAAPFIENTPTSCEDFYLTWDNVSSASNIHSDQVLPVPAGVTLKTPPAKGSVMSKKNLPVWDWSVVLATGVSFTVKYEYTYRVGMCDYYVIH